MTKQSQAVAKETAKKETPKMAIVEKTGKTTTATATPKVEQKSLTLEELKRKTELMGRLVKKYDELASKHRQVENFIVSHDRDTVRISIYDEQGEQFETNSPKTMEKLLKFWLSEFSEAMKETEEEIRQLDTNTNHTK